MIEITKPGQMNRQQGTFYSDGKLLISGGELYISATKGGQEVFYKWLWCFI